MAKSYIYTWVYQNVNQYFSPLRKWKCLDANFLITQRWSGCGPYKSLSIKIPGTLSHVHTSISSDFIWEVFGLSGLPSLKKLQPLSFPIRIHLFSWPSGETLKHTHLYNSMTGLPRPCTVLVWQQLLQVCHPPAGPMVHQWHHQSPTNSRDSSSCG